MEKRELEARVLDEYAGCREVGAAAEAAGCTPRRAGAILRAAGAFRGPPGAAAARRRRRKCHRDWKVAVHERDRWCCQLCCEKDKKRLTAHHIRRKALRPELRFEVDNGITLCRRCHDVLVTRREAAFEGLFDAAVAAGRPLAYCVFLWFNWVVAGIEPRLCACGCGLATAFKNGRHKKYVRNHRRRPPSLPRPGEAGEPDGEPDGADPQE